MNKITTREAHLSQLKLYMGKAIQCMKKKEQCQKKIPVPLLPAEESHSQSQSIPSEISLQLSNNMSNPSEPEGQEQKLLIVEKVELPGNDSSSLSLSLSSSSSPSSSTEEKSLSSPIVSTNDQKHQLPSTSIVSLSNENEQKLQDITNSPLLLSPKQSQSPTTNDVKMDGTLPPKKRPRSSITSIAIASPQNNFRKNLTSKRKQNIEKFRKACDENPQKYGIPGSGEFMKSFLAYIEEPDNTITEDVLTDWLFRNPRIRRSFSVHIPPGEKGQGVFSEETGLEKTVKRSPRSRPIDEDISFSKPYALRSSKRRKVEPESPESDLKIDIVPSNLTLKNEARDEQGLYPDEEPSSSDIIDVVGLTSSDISDEAYFGSNEMKLKNVQLSSENLWAIENQPSTSATARARCQEVTAREVVSTPSMTDTIVPSIIDEEVVNRNLKSENLAPTAPTTVPRNTDEIPAPVVTPSPNQTETTSQQIPNNANGPSMPTTEQRPSWYVPYLINELRSCFNAHFQCYGHLVPLVNYLEFIYATYPPLPPLPSSLHSSYPPRTQASNNQYNNTFSTNMH